MHGVPLCLVEIKEAVVFHQSKPPACREPPPRAFLAPPWSVPPFNRITRCTPLPTLPVYSPGRVNPPGTCRQQRVVGETGIRARSHGRCRHVQRSFARRVGARRRRDGDLDADNVPLRARRPRAVLGPQACVGRLGVAGDRERGVLRHEGQGGGRVLHGPPQQGGPEGRQGCDHR